MGGRWIAAAAALVWWQSAAAAPSKSKRKPTPRPAAPVEVPAPAAEPAPTDPGSSPPSSDDDEVIEVIEEPAALSAAASSPSAPASIAERTVFSGWSRMLIALGLEDHSAAPTDPGAVPHDRVVMSKQLHARLGYSRDRDFEAVVSGLVSYGRFSPDDPDDFVGESRGVLETSLREAMIGRYFGWFDLRLGQQRIAWGRGDAFTPNDVIDGFDRREGPLAETELQRLPSFAVRGDFTRGDTAVTVAVSPFFQPDRFDVYGGNWALIQPDAPAPYRVLAAGLGGSIDPSLYPLVQPLLGQTELPPADLSGAAAGARVQTTAREVDLDLYYHYGYDRTPRLAIDPTVSQALATLDPTADPAAVIDLLIGAVAAEQIRSTYERRHHVGASAATPLGPVVVRGDVAFDSDMVFVGRDLQGVMQPAVQGVVGVEYQSGELDKVVTLEGWYMKIFDLPGDDALLLQRRDNVAVAGLGRWKLWDERAQLELRAAVGIHPASYVLRPQLSYFRSNFEWRLGALVLGGEDYTFGDYYRRNLSAYAAVRYGF